MNFYIAGYYLIQGSRKQDWMDKDNLLPEKIWSGSRHISPKFPDSWILGWVSNREVEAKQELENARGIIKLSDAKFFIAQKEFNDLFTEDQFGFPNVFMNSNVALEKHHQYFGSVSDLKLLGFALPENYLENFMTQYNSKDFESVTRNGVYKKLRQRNIYDKSHQIIGYDLLGFDGADYCSFLCGSMESEIHQKYNVRFNQYGLISEYELADKVSKAIRNGEETAEEGFWAPWLVFEIGLQ